MLACFRVKVLSDYRVEATGLPLGLQSQRALFVRALNFIHPREQKICNEIWITVLEAGVLLFGVRHA